MADRALRAVRDDELVGRAVVLDERLVDRGLMRSTVSGSPSTRSRRCGRALGEELRGRGHAGLRGLLRAPDTLELRAVLDAPPLVEELPVGSSSIPFARR